MSLPTVADILALPVVAAGRPEVVAGERRLSNAVRWVHISELPDIASLLKGGELLLTTGIALPDTAAGLAEYVRTLHAANLSGLVVELGRRFTASPQPLAHAAEHLGLPVALLHDEVPFVRVTEAAHDLIIRSQREELRASEMIHQIFTHLALEGATTAEIVRRAASMTGRPVVFAESNRRVLHYEQAGMPANELLAEWGRISPMLPASGGTSIVGDGPRWLIMPVGARGQVWGSVALLAGDEPAPSRSRIVLERAAVALALNRLVERDRAGLERQSHVSLLSDILSSATPVNEIEERAGALGVPLADRVLVGCIVRFQAYGNGDSIEREAFNREIGDGVARAAQRTNVRALIGLLSSGVVGILLTSATQASAEISLGRLAAAVHETVRDDRAGRVMMAAGSPIESVREVRRSFREAEQVADAVGSDAPKPCYRLQDVGLRGLLHLLREDPRVQTFYQRELGRLLEARGHDAQLLPIVQAYLDHGRNKSEAAAALGYSRTAFYAKLARAESLLGVNLDSVEDCLSLHVALLGFEPATAARRGGRAADYGP